MCPPYSKPPSEMQSTPMRCAVSAWRTDMHLWITIIFASLSICIRLRPSASGMESGERPAVWMIVTPSSIAPCTISW